MKKKNGLFKIIPFYYKGAGSGPLSRIRIRLKVVRIRNTEHTYGFVLVLHSFLRQGEA